MLLLTKLLIGGLMIIITAIIHGMMSDFVFRFIENNVPTIAHTFKRSWRMFTLIISVFIVSAALMTDIWLWTLLFYFLESDILPDIDTALYFTTSTFTTVGYGDIVLPPEWRLLAACCAINGMILFGWSTAFIFEIMASLYRQKK